MPILFYLVIIAAVLYISIVGGSYMLCDTIIELNDVNRKVCWGMPLLVIKKYIGVLTNGHFTVRQKFEMVTEPCKILKVLLDYKPQY